MEFASIQRGALTTENAAARAAALLSSVPPYPGSFAGRGIVICAGGAGYLREKKGEKGRIEKRG